MKIANKIMMTLTGLLFIAATVLKSRQVMTEPIVSDGFWESWEFFMIQIPLELGLGIWLVSGLFRKAGWLLGVLAFASFIFFTGQKALVGAESCGCFGTIHVNPWVTLFAIDLPFLIGLLIFRPKGEKFLGPPWPSAGHFFSVLVFTLALFAVILPMLLSNKVEPVTPGDIIKLPGQGTGVTPPPEDPVDPNDLAVAVEEWSMFAYVDIADRLREGMVVMLFYHHDCEDCGVAIPVYSEKAKDFGDEMKVAFIAVPPYGPEGESPIPADTTCLTGKLAELEKPKKWYIGTPYVVVTIEGVMVREWELKAPDLDEVLEAVFSIE